MTSQESFEQFQARVNSAMAELKRMSETSSEVEPSGLLEAAPKLNDSDWMEQLIMIWEHQ